jgi:heme/copper-type cytochrome/quinol oxidase subunit 4
MIRADPRVIVLIGFMLVVAGVILPFLMVMKVIAPNWILSFVSFAASVSGVMLGLVGAALWTRIDMAQRRRDYSDQDWD